MTTTFGGFLVARAFVRGGRVTFFKGVVYFHEIASLNTRGAFGDQLIFYLDLRKPTGRGKRSFRNALLHRGRWTCGNGVGAAAGEAWHPSHAPRDAQGFRPRIPRGYDSSLDDGDSGPDW